jgi:hypothetical protein
MSREAHVQFCESLGVRFPGATHPSVKRLRKSSRRYTHNLVFLLLQGVSDRGGPMPRLPYCWAMDPRYRTL